MLHLVAHAVPGTLLFRDWTEAHALWQRLARVTGVRALVLMPDHVHLLVEATDDGSDGRAFIARSKQYSGFHFRARTTQRLWQRDSFERVLRDTEGSLAVSRYILANPVRAGLVARPFDYPFSGSFAWDRQALLDVFIESKGGYEEFSI